jgi:hypothetical protein
MKKTIVTLTLILFTLVTTPLFAAQNLGDSIILDNSNFTTEGAILTLGKSDLARSALIADHPNTYDNDTPVIEIGNFSFLQNINHLWLSGEKYHFTTSGTATLFTGTHTYNVDFTSFYVFEGSKGSSYGEFTYDSKDAQDITDDIYANRYKKFPLGSKSQIKAGDSLKIFLVFNGKQIKEIDDDLSSISFNIALSKSTDAYFYQKDGNSEGEIIEDSNGTSAYQLIPSYATNKSFGPYSFDGGNITAPGFSVSIWAGTGNQTSRLFDNDGFGTTERRICEINLGVTDTGSNEDYTYKIGMRVKTKNNFHLVDVSKATNQVPYQLIINSRNVKSTISSEQRYILTKIRTNYKNTKNIMAKVDSSRIDFVDIEAGVYSDTIYFIFETDVDTDNSYLVNAITEPFNYYD